ncbi:MAG TPA: SDR family oxidoreductase [Verrucomicrobiales bacterium]|nr:SDR family oxidoreductase [Verrucomicrobiales bacterium]HRJ07295.1 SDR family oxidoreductase [Prosthecobacter sp.]HRK13478.1 SDR family oxidoreductase [Prosthecobacter sp.]
MTPAALITGGKGALAVALRAELEAQGWQVHAPGREVMDVTDPGSVSDFTGALERLDLLVHNAGLILDAPLAKMSAASFDTVLQAHLRGAFLCARAALRLMVRKRAGHLVFIGSRSALTGPAGQANYAAAKAGLIGLAQSLAAEYGPRGIRANVVLPGFLETPMTASLLAQPEKRARVMAEHSLGHLNTCAEAARFIVFLHTLPHTSGQVFHLDSRIHRWA